MENYLVITALGKHNPALIEQFTRAIKECGCNIIESRMTVLGSEFCVLMMLSGTWDAIAKIEDILPKLGSKIEMSVMTKRTVNAKEAGTMMPYAIDVVSLDHIGIVYDIVKFIAENNIGIQDMHTNTYKASNTGTHMFSLHMAINIPVDASIASIRGEFMEFCDKLNLDAIMEPVK